MTRFCLIFGIISSFSVMATPLEKECLEKSVDLYSEFVPGFFDVGRSTVGQDQVDPIKEKILNYIKSNSDVVVTSVKVTSSSSKIPFFIVEKGKKKIDPKSAEKNLSLAMERATFMEKTFKEVKSSQPSYEKIQFEVSAELSGPEFVPLDLNDRFVTNMTPGYQQRIEALHKSFEKDYKDLALKSSAKELMDEKHFQNLFQAKFKPFHGFRILIMGFKKSESKCSDYSSGKDQNSKASKQ